MTTSHRIDNIAVVGALARQRSGFALEQHFYVDPNLFRRDIEQLLTRHWLCAGHESSAANSGDYFLFDLAEESVIVVRGQEGALRAFANVCRHRGSRVCAQPAGTTKNFVCPYHAWTYGLDGRLLAARHMPTGFDATRYGLKPVHLRVIEGVVFVTLNPTPLGLAKVETTLKSCLSPYGWSAARVAHRATYTIAANWKLAVENYLECYHCAPSHPEYSRLHALEQPTARIATLTARMEQRAAALGIDIPLHDHRVPATSGEETVYGFRYPLYDGVSTGSEDGTPVAPLMGGFADYDGAVTSIHLAPASFLVAYPDHGVIYRFIAKTPTSCEMELIWLVREGAREGVDYDLGRLTWLWKVTSEADKRIVEQNQLGVSSRFYEPGPYAPMEENTRQYIDWYLAEIA
ncbi:MAG: aromatic ring-hydroxylating dioxygenase subunit alpha [Proteobacteria bacterium]|nr:aromatic ring-hydroxylating dioxygenase subunit alpha [Pseudomonadota bacterium]